MCFYIGGLLREPRKTSTTRYANKKEGAHGERLKTRRVGDDALIERISRTFFTIRPLQCDAPVSMCALSTLNVLSRTDTAVTICQSQFTTRGRNTRSECLLRKRIINITFRLQFVPRHYSMLSPPRSCPAPHL